MTYSKQTRQEEQEIERMEDIKQEKGREIINEINDGQLDTFISDNLKHLIANFIDNYNQEWQEHCKQAFKEANE